MTIGRRVELNERSLGTRPRGKTRANIEEITCLENSGIYSRQNLPHFYFRSKI